MKIYGIPYESLTDNQRKDILQDILNNFCCSDEEVDFLYHYYKNEICDYILNYLNI